MFFATGTGEAPHNAMVVELLRKGHMGPIVSAVTVRNLADLGYIDKNRELESPLPQLPLPAAARPASPASPSATSRT